MLLPDERRDSQAGSPLTFADSSSAYRGEGLVFGWAPHFIPPPYDPLARGYTPRGDKWTCGEESSLWGNKNWENTNAS